jgi:hypothetical protein
MNNFDIIIDENFIGPSNQEELDNIISNENFPWYINQSSALEKYPFLGHTLIPRYNPKTEDPSINSNYFYPFYAIFLQFCNKHNLKVDQIYRSSINLTTNHDLSVMGDPHVDHEYEHMNLIMYLNDIPQVSKYNGSTIIFDQQYDGEKTAYEISERFTIKHEISAQKGKIICFNGKYYHTIKWPPPGIMRFTCIFTFSIH